MNFQQLLAKMQELDGQPTEQLTTEMGCGNTPTPLSAAPSAPDTPPPSMSVNINAQGLENIEDMMKLFQKVNPDMGPKEPMSSISIKPAQPPLKMLPDMDADNDAMPGGEIDSMMKIDDKKEEWDNEPDEEHKDVDYMVNKLSGGLGRQQGTYPKVSGADNPMQKVKENTDLRSQIRAELLRRLEESKGEQ